MAEVLHSEWSVSRKGFLAWGRGERMGGEKCCDEKIGMEGKVLQSGA